jgi:hypothetical protein
MLPETLGATLKLSLGVVRSRLAELEDADFLKVDAEAPQVWLRGYVETQLGGPPSASRNWAVNTAASIAALPQTAMISEYLVEYGLTNILRTPKKKGLPKGHTKGIQEGLTKGIQEGLTKGSPKGAAIRSYARMRESDAVAVGAVPSTVRLIEVGGGNA